MTTHSGGWRNERIGLLNSVQTPQLGFLAVGAVPMLVCVERGAWTSFLGWLVAWLVMVAAVVIPIRERPAWKWCAHGVGHLVGRITTVSAWQSSATSEPISAERAQELDLPGVLQGFEVFDGLPSASSAMRRLCVLKDPDAGWVMVAKVSHPGLSLTDPDAGNRWASALGDMLAAISRGTSLPHRVSIYVRTVPDDGAERTSWLEQNSPTTIGGRAIPAQVLKDADEVERSVLSQSVSHEVYVAYRFSEDAIANEAKGSGRGLTGRIAVMYRALPELGNLLAGCGADGVTWMTKGEVAAAIRTGFNPAALHSIQVARAAGAQGHDAFTDVHPVAAGPSAAPSPSARCYTHDGFRSVAYSIVLPEMGTMVGSLGPLLTPAAIGERRSLALHYEPFDDKAATRAAESDSTSAYLAQELKSKRGFKVSARSTRLRSQTGTQEQVLAAGHTLTRMTGVAVVTAPTSQSIETHMALLEASARRRKFELMRLDLAQPLGFISGCIPVGVGMPTRRGKK